MGQLKRILSGALLCFGLLLLCTAGASALDLGIGTVTGDGLRLREQPSTDAAILDMAAAGDRVVVLEDAGNGWYKVDHDCVEGYMSAQYVTLATQSDVGMGYGLVQAEGGSLNIRSGPGTGYDRVGSLTDGTVVTITGMDSGWFKIDTGSVTGYVSSDYMVTCKDSAGSRGDVSRSAEPTPPPVAETVPVSPLGWQVPIVAEWFLGIPYVWGGSSPEGFDCSGFTHYVFSLFGYDLNRTATGQLDNGVPVSREELLPGDLVFFYNGQVSTPVSHVGIYVGDNRFIHASTNSYRVQYDSLDSNFYHNAFVYARRIF